MSRKHRNALAAAIERLTAERDAAHAIIAGRDVAPTDAELEAHHAAGGAWLVAGDGWARLRSGELADESAAWCRPERTDLHHGTTRVWRWTALDSQNRPCAWPVVP